MSTGPRIAAVRIVEWLLLGGGLASFVVPTGGATYARADESPRPALHDATVTGDLVVLHTVTITFSGPAAGETAEPNPFRDCRLDVAFTQGHRTRVVPGYFAADGNAGETGATEGNKWRVHFVPETAGPWEYRAVLAAGPDAAVVDHAAIVAALGGAFVVQDDAGSGPWRKGFLRHAGERYYRYSGSGEYFLKGGADSPENFLAYVDFDGTCDTDGLTREGEATGGLFLHRYEAHVQDWRPGDPTWRGERGKGIIGALNYLAAKGMNSVYFVTYNLDGGDGKDTWPWIDPQSRTRFDVSKLDQWQVVLDHMDRRGLMAHIITQETENDQALDGGELGPVRRLYYRELIARFGHKRLLTWNLGEENTNTPDQLQDFIRYFRKLDPYDHPLVVHTFPGKYDEVFAPLLGVREFNGASLQMNQSGDDTHAETIKWLERSAAAGWTWLVCLDEFGHGAHGVQTDALDPGHDQARRNCLWANLMAGGAGVEWYFGYQYPHNDLNCEDWRSRDHLWDLTRLALGFFHAYLPFTEMSHADHLTSAADDFCFAQPGRVYAIYLPEGGTTSLQLPPEDRAYDVAWWDPRTGGELQRGSVSSVRGPGSVALGDPPGEPDADWMVLVRSR
ncbi:MAG: DUF5060 domain-containing protein [Pirellulaceae bacterium]|jgi:hypothetical protein|nr:DUF5060 domain-containing protein [Pirellulaceae bacterium]